MADANNGGSIVSPEAPKAEGLVTRNLTDLVPHPRNPRKHPEAQLTEIASSIKKRGFTNPVLIDPQNTILAGVARVLAAQKAGMLSVPCIVLDGLTEVEKAAYVIADNKLALNAEWDEEMLVAELGRLAELEFDLDLTGFCEVEMAMLAEGVGSDLCALATQAIPAQPGEDQPVAGQPVADQPVVNQAGKPQPIVTHVGEDQIDANQAASGPPAVVKPAAVQPGDRHREAQNAWKGMPEFNQPEAGPFRTIYVHFKDQAAVDAFAKLIGQKVTDKTKSVWYPAVARVAAELVYG